MTRAELQKEAQSLCDVSFTMIMTDSKVICSFYQIEIHYKESRIKQVVLFSWMYALAVQTRNDMHS